MLVEMENQKPPVPHPIMKIDARGFNSYPRKMTHEGSHSSSSLARERKRVQTSREDAGDGPKRMPDAGRRRRVKEETWREFMILEENTRY